MIIPTVEARFAVLHELTDLEQQVIADGMRVFEVMRRASHHRFQILTKRAERLAGLDGQLPGAEHLDGCERRERRLHLARRASPQHQ